MFERFKSREKLEKSIEELESEYDILVDARRKISDDIAELKQSWKMEDEAMRHVAKMKGAELDLDHQRLNLEKEEEKDKAIAEVEIEYHKKLEMVLQKQTQDVKEMYNNILKVFRDRK